MCVHLFFLSTNAIISVWLPSIVRCFLLDHMVLTHIFMGTQGGSEIRDSAEKGLSGSPRQSLSWLLVLCVPSTGVKPSDKTQSE